MQAPTPEYWNRLSEAFASGNKSEAMLLAMQLFPGIDGGNLVNSCVEAGETARLLNDQFTAEGFFRLAITLYDRFFIDEHKAGISAVRKLIQLLEGQSCADEAWRVLVQTEDLCARAAGALMNHLLLAVDRPLTA